MKTVPPSALALFLLTALSLSLGWGIRGNYGHEIGAMLPGALAAMAAVLLSGREDWWRRVHYFAFFGALGWSFGGSISYMQVIAYTHSGHSGSVLYGFASLFVIGFLWGALGGAGTALPALLDRERLTEFFAPLLAVFGVWVLQSFVEARLETASSDFRHENPLYWFDTDWLAALTALIAVLALAAARRRWDGASSLLVHLALGWWVGFVGFVLVLGWRMTPPRGDNWAGCIGMVGGLLVFCRRRQLPGLALATLGSGFIGGFGFATATLLKLLELKSGWQTNWHSVLEQSYGFINGLGVACVMLLLARRAPVVTDGSGVRRWTEGFALGFVLIGITWLNLKRNPAEWVKAKTVPAEMYGWPAAGWFHFGYLALAVALVWVLARPGRRSLALLPSSWLGRGQLLYLVLLWWMVAGNLGRAVVAFAPQRLITEGVIHLNAVACTLLVLLGTAWRTDASRAEAGFDFGPWVRRTVWIGVLGMSLSVLADWAAVRALYGDRFAGHAGKHIRFGPDATATKEKPKAGQPHP